MIGQGKILKWVDNNIDTFPHFIILVGPNGCGKRSLSKVIANKLSLVYTECEIRAEAVREVIDTSYQSHTKVLYCFADADNMKAAAKNAMLKITEEPPQDAYFCLTVCDDSSLLDTIRSRAYVLTMQEYSIDEIFHYYWTLDNTPYLTHGNPNDAEIVSQICSTPGEVNKILSYGVEDFYEYVKLVVDNIAYVEPANAFKSSNKLAIKTDDGYDLGLFFKCFVWVCIDRLNTNNLEEVIHYCKGVIVTTTILNEVGRMGINKQQLYDKWVFNIRKEWA